MDALYIANPVPTQKRCAAATFCGDFKVLGVFFESRLRFLGAQKGRSARSWCKKGLVADVDVECEWVFQALQIRDPGMRKIRAKTFAFG